VPSAIVTLPQGTGAEIAHGTTTSTSDYPVIPAETLNMYFAPNKLGVAQAQGSVDKTLTVGGVSRGGTGAVLGIAHGVEPLDRARR